MTRNIATSLLAALLLVGAASTANAAPTQCGYLIYTVKQRRRGRRWSKLIVGYNLNRRVQKLKGARCKFPRKSKWRKIERKLTRNALIKRSGYPYKRGDVIYVFSARWRVKRHPVSRRPLYRKMMFFHYSKRFPVK